MAMEGNNSKLHSFKDVIESLRKRNSASNDWAKRTLAQAGRPILNLLVKEAGDRSKSATHRVRILKVIEQIGFPSSFRARGEIYVMTYDAPPSVRNAAARLIRDLMYDVKDDISEKSPETDNEPSNTAMVE